jgi:hypothetical protein
MSELTTIHGAIHGAFVGNENWHEIYRLNSEAIDELPVEDEWPPLERDFFKVPEMDATRPGYYRVQMIHFGCAFNHFADDWSTWLQKFEGLIAKMFWSKVRLHLEVEIRGKYDYLWDIVSKEQFQRYYEIPPRPPSEWEFSGGPRDFS